MDPTPVDLDPLDEFVDRQVAGLRPLYSRIGRLDNEDRAGSDAGDAAGILRRIPIFVVQAGDGPLAHEHDIARLAAFDSLGFTRAMVERERRIDDR